MFAFLPPGALVRKQFTADVVQKSKINTRKLNNLFYKILTRAVWLIFMVSTMTENLDGSFEQHTYAMATFSRLLKYIFRAYSIHHFLSLFVPLKTQFRHESLERLYLYLYQVFLRFFRQFLSILAEVVSYEVIFYM